MREIPIQRIVEDHVALFAGGLWQLLNVKMEARVGIEPASTALQAAA